MRINVTPKDGGNRFSGSFFLQGASGNLQAENRSEEVENLPLLQASTMSISSTRASGGRSNAIRSGSTCRAGARVPAVRAGAVFLMERKWAPSRCRATTGFITRLTWQATQANKFRLSGSSVQREDYNNVSATISPEASQQAFGGGWTPQVKWTSTPTNRLLIDAGITLYDLPYEVAYQDSVGPRDLPNYEQTTLALTVATTNPYTSWTENWGTAASRCPT